MIIIITDLVLRTAVLAKQSFAYQSHNSGGYHNNGGYQNKDSPVSSVLVGEMQSAYGKKFYPYQKFKNGPVIAQYTKTVSNSSPYPLVNLHPINGIKH